MNSFVLADCTTVDAALSQVKNGAVVKAGGIDLLERMIWRDCGGRSLRSACQGFDAAVAVD
jgi:hypothetical protein